ncbi:hypothetical protein BY996DRAFT_6412964 [Phakopsora pachyrhizi]|nr:hypothetical protein BY996DRAFT_6412964 [Phakopsora pachyrhizi]
MSEEFGSNAARKASLKCGDFETAVYDLLGWGEQPQGGSVSSCAIAQSSLSVILIGIWVVGLTLLMKSLRSENWRFGSSGSISAMNDPTKSSGFGKGEANWVLFCDLHAKPTLPVEQMHD